MLVRPDDAARRYEEGPAVESDLFLTPEEIAEIERDFERAEVERQSQPLHAWDAEAR